MRCVARGFAAIRTDSACVLFVTTYTSKQEAGSMHEANDGKLQLVEKHPRAIRWMHWVNFPVLSVMIWSGLLIYWGDSIPPYQHAHQVYRIGIGSWTLVRLFPDWF